MAVRYFPNFYSKVPKRSKQSDCTQSNQLPKSLIVYRRLLSSFFSTRSIIDSQVQVCRFSLTLPSLSHRHSLSPIHFTSLCSCFRLSRFHEIGARMANYSAKGAPSNGSVYVCNLPPGTNEDMLAEFFGTIGVLKKDKRTGRPKIWLYRDKVTNEPKGDATVTYEDPHAALAAVEWFNNKDFHGVVIGVFMAESKSKDEQSFNSGNNAGDPNLDSDFGGPEDIARDANGGGGQGRGRGDASGKAWQQEGDWVCPNTRSVM